MWCVRSIDLRKKAPRFLATWPFSFLDGQKAVCSLDVEVGNETGVNIVVLVSSVDLDLSVIVTEGSKAWNGPCDGVGVFVSSTIATGVVWLEILRIEVDGSGSTLGSEQHRNHVTNNISIVVEYHVEAKCNPRADNRRVRGCGTSSHIVEMLRVAFGPLDGWSRWGEVGLGGVELHLDGALLGGNSGVSLDRDIEGNGCLCQWDEADQSNQGRLEHSISGEVLNWNIFIIYYFLDMTIYDENLPNRAEALRHSDRHSSFPKGHFILKFFYISFISIINNKAEN